MRAPTEPEPGRINDLLAIARQLRGLQSMSEDYIARMVPPLLAEAVALGAFDRVEYLQLRYLLKSSQTGGRYDPDAFVDILRWLRQQIDALPLGEQLKAGMNSLPTPDTQPQIGLATLAEIVEEEVRYLRGRGPVTGSQPPSDNATPYEAAPSRSHAHDVVPLTRKAAIPEPDGVYPPNRVRLQRKNCETLSPTQMKIVAFMLDKGSAPRKDLIRVAWKIVPSDEAIRTMLNKLNGKLHADHITITFYFRNGHIVKT